MLKRLRIKFVCIVMIIVTVMICVILTVVMSLTHGNLESQSIQMMQSIAAEPFHMGRPDKPPEEIRLPFFSLQIGPKGELIAVGGGYYDLSDQEFLSELIDITAAEGRQSGIISEYNLRYLRTSTPLGQRLIFADISSEINTMYNLGRTCLIIGMLSFFVFLVVCLLLARWAVKPVEEAWERQKQFVADASHELKTPLTVITTNAELLADPSYSEGERKNLVQNILIVSRQMRGLTESLLNLARADDGAKMTYFEETDLSQLVSDTCLPFEAVFFEHGLMLSTEIAPGIRILCCEEWLRQVVDILLDNAVKYSYSGTEISLRLERKGRRQSLLTLANKGEAIATEDLQNIFKRFYRADKARSMNQSYGLGLSIAQTIVLAHKGRIWAESQGDTNIFRVLLPVLQQ